MDATPPVVAAALDARPVWERVSEQRAARQAWERFRAEVPQEAVSGYLELLQACGAGDPVAIAQAREQFTDLRTR